MHNILWLIKELCAKHGIAISELERSLNFSENSFYKWNKISPSIDKVKAVADYFNVSLDYLIGRTQIPTQIDETLSDPELVTIQRLRANLSSRDREKMMAVMYAQFSEDFPKNEEGKDDDIQK